MRLLTSGFILIASLAATAAASELRYTPLNPSFGGNPFNSSHLLAKASAQNDHQRPTTTTTDAENLQRTIQSAIVNQTAFNIADKIFKPNKDSFGIRIVDLDTSTARTEHIQNADGTVTIFITDKRTGTLTTVGALQNTTTTP